MIVLHVALCTAEKTKQSQTKKQHKLNSDNDQSLNSGEGLNANPSPVCNILRGQGRAVLRLEPHLAKIRDEIKSQDKKIHKTKRKGTQTNFLT
jgi:hypothetical protein